MAIESDKTIFMGMSKPSDKCLLVSIPMSMYRVHIGFELFSKGCTKIKVYAPD